jgi:L-serine dehydratase
VKYRSIFDVLGHVIVGPSSSHTAGACQIAYIARHLFGTQPENVRIGLHGSFAETYRGHGSDIAIVAGLLGLSPENGHIPEAFQLAQQANLNYEFESIDLGSDVHPNTIQLVLKGGKDELTILGSSIGGGNIIIDEINGLEAGFMGNVPTLIILNKDKPGMLAVIADKITAYQINIGGMKISRDVKKRLALMWIELDSPVPPGLIDELTQNKDIKWVKMLNV